MRKIYVLLFLFLCGWMGVEAQVTQTFSSSGSFTVPAGVTSMNVYVYGAGGGSGGCATGTGDQAGGGGGGGACAIKTLTVAVGQSYTITVGAAGTAGPAGGATAGGTGGASTISGTGGTVTANGGTGGGGAASSGASGTSGVGATAGAGYTTIFVGGNGTIGYRNTSNETGGAGGGGAGNNGAGGNGSGAVGSASTGGAAGAGTPNTTPYKGAAGASAVNTAGTLAGVAGSAPGGGAAGAASYNATAAGAVGGAGQVVIVYTPACTTPTAPTTLGLTPGPGTVTGTFTAPGTAPTGYLVIRTLGTATPTTPVLGTTYTPGTSALGGTIVSTNTTTGFSDAGLAFSTQYTYTVYSYNSGCATTNPVYSTTNITGTTTTSACTVATNTMAITAAGTYSWNTAANWSAGHVPYACENAVITASGTTNGAATVNLASNVVVNSLSMTVTGAGGAAAADALIFNTNAFSITLAGDLSLTNTSAGAGAHQLEFNISAGGAATVNNFNTNINGTAGTNGNLIDVNTLGTFLINGATLAKAPATGGAGGQVQVNAGNSPAAITFMGNAVFDDGTTSSVSSIYIGSTAATGNTTGTMTFKSNATFGAKAFSIQGNIHGGNIFDAASAQTLTVNNATTMFFPSVLIGNSNTPTVTMAGTGNPIIDATAPAPLGLTVSANSTLDLSTHTFNVSAAATSTFTLLAGATLKVGGTTGGMTGSNFPKNFSAYGINATSTIVYNASAAQTAVAGAYGNLSIANSAAATPAVTLNGVTTVAGTLTLTNGVLLTTTTNTITLSNSAVSALSGGSSGSYISGPLNRTLPSGLSSDGSTYFFPVGAGTTYLPYSLTTLNTGATAPVLQVTANAATSGGTADGTTLGVISTSEYWQTKVISGNYGGGSISLGRGTALGALDAIGKSSTANGTYSSLNGISGTLSGQNSINNSDQTGAIAASASQFDVIAGKPAITVSTLSPASVTTTYGTQSSNMTYTLSGVNLASSGVTITAPAGFEISTSAASGFASSITVPASGTLASTIIYVRLIITDNVGSYSGNVTNVNGVASASVTISTSTVTPAAITIAANNQMKCEGSSYIFSGTEFSITSGALQNGQTLTSVMLTSAGASAGAAGGSYPIVPSAPYAGSFTPSNYTITLVNGNFTVTPTANAGTVSGTTPLCIGQTTTYLVSGTTLSGGTGAFSSTNTAVATVNPTTGLVTAVGAGSTNITYTITGGCGGTTSSFQTLTVNPNANAGILSGPSSLCTGGSGMVTTNGDAGGTFMSSNNLQVSVDATTGAVTALLPTLGTPVTITYTVTSGCNPPSSSTFNITVGITGTAGTISGTTPLCVGQTATFTTSGTGGGMWASSNTAAATVNPSTGVLTAVGSGMTNITYSLTPGTCVALSTATFALTVNTDTYLGNSSDWTDAANWTCGVPTATMDVIIPNGLSNYPVITTTAVTAHNVTIASAASITVNNTGIFSLYGAITNAGIFDIVDGTLDLAGNGVSVAAHTLLDSTVKTLSVSNNASLGGTANSDTLKVTQNISFGNTSGKSLTTNGNLTLVSNALNTASIDDITNNGANSGNAVTGDVTVERYIPAGRKWRFLSVPTATTQSVRDSWMEGATSIADNPKPGHGVIVTGSGAGFDASTSTPSLKYYDAATSNYIGITSPSEGINSHRAYYNYIRGDRTALPSPATVSSTILRTTGTLKQNDYSFGVAAGTIDAVGNPFASRIDLRKLITGSISPNITGNVYVWDPKLTSGYGLGAYQTLTLSGGNFHVSPGGGSYGGVFSVANYIESGEGFFVQANSSAGTVNFHENQKASGSSDVQFAGDQSQFLAGLLYIRDAGGNPTLVDGTAIYFDDSYNNAIDYNDAIKLTNINENVSNKRFGTLLASEQRQPVLDGDSIQFNVTGYRSNSNYQWQIFTGNMDAPGRTAVLVDRFLSTSTPIDLTTNLILNFSITGSAGSYAANRFAIVFIQGNVLPVTLTSVSATRQADKSITVKWNTAAENAIAYYEVERSANGNIFTSVGSSNATNNNGGSAAYSFNDVSPLGADNYYRIKVLSLNGSAKYSAVVKVSPLNETPSVAVYPNPIAEDLMNVKFTNKVAGKYTLQLVNKAGQTVYSSAVTISGSDELKIISLKGNIAAGAYQLVIRSEAGEKSVVSVEVL